MQERILQYIKSNQMIGKGDRVVVGVSGGADSICLLHTLYACQSEIVFTMIVVHINHHLRGEEASADERFVKELCQQLQIPYQSVEINVKEEAAKRKVSIEEAGRLIRREVFERIADDCGASKIALGHHQDDQAETVIFNMVRGSALAGLCGIHPIKGQYIRPLLAINREEIEEYLTNSGFRWRVDSSNLTEVYTRNKIRHRVLGYLKEEVNQKAGGHIANAAEHLQEVEAYLKDQTKVATNQYTKVKDNHIFINEQLYQEATIIQKNVMRSCINRLAGSLKDINKENIIAMTTIFNKKVGKQIEIGQGIVISRSYTGAVLKKADKGLEEAMLQSTKLPVPGQCQVGQVNFSCEINDQGTKRIVDNTYTKWFDYDKIKGDLIIRTRTQGDVITTCVGGGKKKLKDYFIDTKIPQAKRDKILLVTVGSEVLWVVGNRVSEKYKVSQSTRQILMIKMEEGKQDE